MIQNRYKKIALLLCIITVVTFILGIITPLIVNAEEIGSIKWKKIYDNHEISSITYGKNVYVAVGVDGVIKTSADGTDWNIADGGVNLLNDITWGYDKFVAVGTKGTIYTSNDGYSWERVFLGIDNDLRSIVWNGKKYIIVGDRGTILSSTDGSNWTSMELETPYSINKVINGNGKFIATISDTFNIILTSVDGTTWTEIEPIKDYYGYYNIAFNGVKYIMWGKVPHEVGYITLISDDGVNWSILENAPELTSITVQNDMFVGLGKDGLYYSNNGLGWTKQNMEIEDAELKDIYYLNDKFIIYNYNGNIFTSNDGTVWTKVNSSIENELDNLGLSKDGLESNNTAYNGSIYVYVGGQSKIYGGEGNSSEAYREIGISNDKKNWDIIRTDNSPALKSIVYANGIFVAVGDEGTIIYSKDGQNWNDFNYKTSDDISKIIWNGEDYIAVGNKSILKGTPISNNNIDFKDIKGHWAETIINDAATRKIINGIDKDTFAPNKAITRAEFATIIVRALNLKTKNELHEFSDVSTEDWFYNEVSAAFDNGILMGYGNDIIRPNASITREEAMAIIERAIGIKGISANISKEEISEYLAIFKDKNDISNWALNSAAICVKLDIFEGYKENIRPKDDITRAETTKIVLTMLDFK